MTAPSSATGWWRSAPSTRYAAWAERAVEEQPTGALPPHCGHVILDDEGRQVDYWPKLGQQEER